MAFLPFTRAANSAADKRGIIYQHLADPVVRSAQHLILFRFAYPPRMICARINYRTAVPALGKHNGTAAEHRRNKRTNIGNKIKLNVRNVRSELLDRCDGCDIFKNL